MARNLKTLGLGLATAFAMTALTASAAQAAPEFWTIEAATIKATYHTSPNFVTKIPSVGTITCSSLTSEAKLPKPELKLETTNLNYTGCHTQEENYKVTVVSNGCGYWYTVKWTLAADEFEGEMDVYCPTKPLEFRVEEEAEVICTVEVPEQTGGSPVLFTNSKTVGGQEVLTVKMNATVRQEYHGSLCGSGEKTDTESAAACSCTPKMPKTTRSTSQSKTQCDPLSG